MVIEKVLSRLYVYLKECDYSLFLLALIYFR